VKTSRVLLSWFLLAVALLATACGKKGPPLAPLMAVPARIADLTARRIGDTVYLKFTIPSMNAIGTRPADLARVDVFAFTALSPHDVLDVRDMVRVASIAVRRPPDPEPEPKVEKPPKPGEEPKQPTKEGPPKPPKPPKPREPGEDQGQLYTVTEELTPALQTVTVGTRNPKTPPATWFAPVTKLLDQPPVTPPLAGVVFVAQPTRFYVAMGVSRRGVKAALSPFVGVSLQLAPPSTPAAPVLTVTERAVGLVWEPPAGAPAPPYAVPRAFTELDAFGAANAATATAAGRLAAAVGVPATISAAAASLAKAMAAAIAMAPARPAVSTAKPPAAAGAKPAAGTTPPTATPAGAKPAAATAALTRIPPPPAPLAATPRGMVLPVLLGYNVYLSGTPVPPPAPPTPGVPPPAPVPISAGTPAPIPLNPAPLATPTFQDTTFVFEAERCYEVRAVNAVGAPWVQTANTLPIPGAPGLPPPLAAGPPRLPPVILPPVWFESASSVKTCVTPKDIFPPPVPTSLAAIGSVGAINLIWEGVEAADLAGYVVLRGAAPDGPMTPLFDTPIRETTYRDTTVKPGVRYVYTVVSVDNATPLNRSLPSNKADEVAR
jgi:hypothetical protein